MRSGLKMPSVMADLMTLIQHEIPDGRQNIHDSHTNLEKVAEYCEANYFQSENKHAALEETKKFATQSLASVAYQINTLAYNLLHLLDLQTAQLSEMESHINHIGQTVMIHKEKVARREIGVLTANKSTLRQHKILAPASQERPVKYIRRPIDYTVLDEVGHGLRTSSAGNGGANKARRIPSSQALMNAGPAPTTKPPTPPQANRGVTMGSLTRGSREYRTPAPPIAPPQVPSNYAANYPLGHPRRGSGYSTLPAHGHHGSSHQSALPPSQMTPPPALASQPQVGMVHPMSQHTMGHHHHSMPHHTVNHPGHMGQQQQQQGVIQNPPMQAGISQNSMVVIPPGSVVHPMSQNPAAPGAMSMGAMGHQMAKVPTSMVPTSMVQSQHYGTMVSAHQPPPPSDPMTSSLTDRLPEPPPPHIMSGGIVPTSEYERHGNAYGHQRPDAQRDSVPKTYLEKVVAIYDYEADKDDELSFSENSVIYVIKKNDDGWYEGVMNGVTGLFPGNYVEPCM
ncbi:abl interactor 2 isoform X4 [Rhipicephalus sanguineus]|uniref:abl interactor 2 isoform X4 n=1 Tax=Rhipicephalus sanguineus TaxID=34632 RepID=UPI0018949862|nr:abl interactor 2 isoform X4 [Rhipicephalus sanguineus]